MKIKDLIKDGVKNITKGEGIYKVIVPKGFTVVFNNKCPNKTCDYYPVTDLQEKYNATKDKSTVYVGKAVNLQKRIRQYINYGLNKGKIHKGGRAIFQIKNFEELEIEIIECKNSATVERQMLIDYRKDNNELPLANWRI